LREDAVHPPALSGWHDIRQVLAARERGKIARSSQPTGALALPVVIRARLKDWLFMTSGRLLLAKAYALPGSKPLRSHDRLADLDQVAVRVANVSADLAAVVLWLREKLSALCRPLLVRLLISATRTLRNALVRFGSGGVVRVTVGLSSVGPPPSLRMSHEFETFMMTGSRSMRTWPSKSD